MLLSHLRGRRLLVSAPPVVAMFADGLVVGRVRRTDAGHCVGDAIRRNSAGQDQPRRTTVAHGSGENRPGRHLPDGCAATGSRGRGSAAVILTVIPPRSTRDDRRTPAGRPI
jgi:hypothetical protein